MSTSPSPPSTPSISPATSSELETKLQKLEQFRLDDTKAGFAPSSGFNGRFLIPLEGQIWQIIASDRLGWKHVSVTNHQKKQIPPWNVMARVKDLFFQDQDTVVQFHPPYSSYVNDHPFVLHLWMPTDQLIPSPPAWMV